MDKNISNIKERVLYISEYKGISKEKFFKGLDVSYANFKGVQKKSALSSNTLDKILSIYPEINGDWLITGQGEMLKRENEKGKAVKIEGEQRDIEKESIPLIPISAMAGLAQGDISILELDCERYVVPAFKGADYLITIKGSSMYPKYSSGDIIACKILPLHDIFFQWNKVYVLDTVQGALVKRIKKNGSKDKITLVSDNPDYDAFAISLEQVRAVSLVLGVIRLE